MILSETKPSASSAPLGSALEVLEVGVGCSQATLDLIVSFVYSEGTMVSRETAEAAGAASGGRLPSGNPSLSCPLPNTYADNNP
jgi:hypothetical protein